jgi:hypothetical protein
MIIPLFPQLIGKSKGVCLASADYRPVSSLSILALAWRPRFSGSLAWSEAIVALESIFFPLFPDN